MAARNAAGRDRPATLVRSSKGFWLFLIVYAAVLLALLSRFSLWLDEIVDLKGIRDYDLVHLIAWVPFNAGGVPLGYITRFVTVHGLGYSTFSGRLPSPIFSLLACAGVFILARRLKLRFPLLAVMIFALTPLQLRYALESRPYSLALALSVWSTVIFLDLLERVTWRRAFYYGLIALLGLYTQPYTIFVPIAHIVWLGCSRARPNRRRLLLLSGVAVVLAAVGFLPWYLWTTQVWSQSMASEHLHYTIGWKAGLLILRELVGAGYLGSVLILGAAWIGWRKGLQDFEERLFWALCTIVPVLLALIADAAFGYFLAIRQMIFVVVPLSLLAALGIERLRERGRALAALGCVLIAVFFVGDVRFFLRPREDWRAAADILEELSKRGSCVVYAPANTEALYLFFVPDLSRAKCGGDFSRTRAAAVAVSPYGPREQPELVKALREGGLHKGQELNPQGPTIELFER